MNSLHVNPNYFDDITFRDWRNSGKSIWTIQIDGKRNGTEKRL